MAVRGRGRRSGRPILPHPATARQAAAVQPAALLSSTRGFAALPGKETPIVIAAQPPRESPPKDRDILLQRAGSAKAKVYGTVRQTLDELEATAPWDELYYPSKDDAAFLDMELGLIEVIDRIPARVKALIDSLKEEEQDEATRQLLGDAEFFFEGIHGSVAPDVAKLRSKLKALRAAAGDAELTPEERDFTCEIAADIKGKYSSSIMGAAAGLIAEGRWDGVEIEPILFSEKAQEFERNDLLVATLNEVIENITNLLAEVPLAEMVDHWQRQERIDLYALTPLYSFLGNLGKLMKEESRRALYSGDYHQIRKRERLLNVRINELTTLHNMTWATDSQPAMPDGGSPYPRMIQKSTQLAAILDVEILRQIIGEKHVKDLLFIVTIEKERAEAAGSGAGGAEASSMRKSVPEELHPMIPLLYGEDLLNFLSLLLGAVLKRASLALKRQREAAPVPAQEKTPTAEVKAVPEVAAREAGPPAPEVEAPPEPAVPAVSKVDDFALPEIDDALLAESPAPVGPAPPVPAAGAPIEVPAIDTSMLDDLDFDFGFPGEASLPEADLLGSGLPEVDFPEPDLEERQPMPPAEDPRLAEQRAALGQLYDLLEILLSRTNAHRKSFEMVHRLLKLRKTVPPAMLQSMHPYLFDIMNTLIPQLHDLDHQADISASHAAHLFEYCTFLCDRNLTREQMQADVPRTMDRVLRLLDGLHGMASNLV